MGHWLDAQVHPHCGDGVEISVLYTDSVKGTTDVLHAAEYAVQQAPVRYTSPLVDLLETFYAQKVHPPGMSDTAPHSLASLSLLCLDAHAAGAVHSTRMHTTS